MLLVELRPNMGTTYGNRERAFNEQIVKQASVFYESYELLKVDLGIPSTVTGSQKTQSQTEFVNAHQSLEVSFVLIFQKSFDIYSWSTHLKNRKAVF